MQRTQRECSEKCRAEAPGGELSLVHRNDTARDYASDMVVQLGALFVQELVSRFSWTVVADGPRDSWHVSLGAFAIVRH